MTPPRPEPTMTEEEYRSHPALNFSKLAAYYNKGTYSPDHALMTIEFKSYFEYGKQFETMLQDAVKGTDSFGERFFQSTADGKMPDDIIKWIDEGENLEQFYKYNKDGSLSKTCSTKHAFLDEAQKNPGKIPVSVKDWEMLERHTERMLKMKYLDASVEELLARAEWQVPIVWTSSDGLEKKALLDCLVDLGGEYLAMDIKTTAGFKQFSYMLRDKYWIQDIHYTEGVNAKYGVCMQMPFFVASKEAPCLCQPWGIDYGDVEWRANAIEEYESVCKDYYKWEQAGKFPKGWLPLSNQKLFLNK